MAAAVFGAFGESIHVHSGRVIVPGGWTVTLGGPSLGPPAAARNAVCLVECHLQGLDVVVTFFGALEGPRKVEISGRTGKRDREQGRELTTKAR